MELKTYYDFALFPANSFYELEKTSGLRLE